MPVCVKQALIVVFFFLVLSFKFPANVQLIFLRTIAAKANRLSICKFEFGRDNLI